MSPTKTVADLRETVTGVIVDAQTTILDLNRAAAGSIRSAAESLPAVPNSRGAELLEKVPTLARELFDANVKFVTELADVWLPKQPAVKPVTTPKAKAAKPAASEAVAS